VWHKDALDPFVKSSHVSIWKWIQLFGKNALFHKRVTAFLIDETYIRIGKYEAWVWIAIDGACRQVHTLGVPVLSEEHHGCRALSKDSC
jgi:transposase-like protein